MNNQLWISTKDHLPEKDGRYIVCEQYNNNCYWIGISSFKNRKFDGGSIVTHWMDLPNKPHQK